MSNKRKIQGLIAELHELEELLEGIAEYDSAPKVLFKLAINKSSKIITGLGTLSMDDSLRRMADMAVPHPVPSTKQLETLDEDTDSYPDLEHELQGNNVKRYSGESQTECENKVSEQQPVVELQTKQLINDVADLHLKEESANKDALKHEPKVLVDDLVQRHLATSLFKTLTLNDRFRFQRELFGNNSARLYSVLEELDRKDSIQDALAYILDDLSWDIDDEAVKDFIQILEKRFL